MLAVEGYIPEIWLGGSGNNERLDHKADYWWQWLRQDVPVMMDVSPGYDAHIVFPSSSFYGYTTKWRSGIWERWSPTFCGIVYNAWNGYPGAMLACVSRSPETAIPPGYVGSSRACNSRRIASSAGAASTPLLPSK